VAPRSRPADAPAAGGSPGPPAADDTTAEAEAALYAGPVEGFVERRTALARELRQRKERDAATRVGGLRRPTLGAWALDQVAHGEPDRIARLLAVGDELRRALDAAVRGDAAALRAAQAEQRAVVDDVVRAALGALEAGGHATSDTVQRRIADTVHAALVDEAVADELRVGRLTAEHDAPGFGMGLDLVAAAAAAAPAARTAPAAPAARAAAAAPAPAARAGAPTTPAPTERQRRAQEEREAREARAQEARAERERKAQEAREAEEQRAQKAAALDEEARRLAERAAELAAEADEAEARALAARSAAREAQHEAKRARRTADQAAARSSRIS
jgi:hypothetical protein